MRNFDFGKYLKQQSFNEAFVNKKYDNLKSEIIFTLEELALNGFLKPVVFSDLHETNFSYAWNKFVNQEISLKKDDSFLMGQIGLFVEKLLIYNIWDSSSKNNEDQFRKFIEFLNKGDFETFCAPEGECFNCGSYLNIKFKGWDAMFFEFKDLPSDKVESGSNDKDSDLFWNKMAYFPADSCFSEFVKIKEVELKTGNLIITDWIRLKEFNNVVEPKGDIYHFNVNSAKGRSEAFEHYLTKGVISVPSFSGLDCYSLKDEAFANSFVFGKMDFTKTETEFLNKKKFVFEESVNRGLRATTIIEEERLVEIVNESTKNPDKAKKIVDDYLEQNKSDILRRKVKVGTYNLIFDFRNRDVSDLMFNENLPSCFQPKIFLYPKEFSFNNEVCVGQKKKKMRS